MTNLSSYDRVFLLTDEQAAKCCLPVFLNHMQHPDIASTLVVPAGEQHKNILTVQQIWDWLFAQQATRRSLLINLGGGVICDMGGFAAATYMRGMSFLNVPTTLLAMVDAGAGGKTGIDYSPTSNSVSGLTAQRSNSAGSLLKNAIGTFAEPIETIILPDFLQTLPPEQLLSGFAEMVKHSILDSPAAFADILNLDLRDTQSDTFARMLHASIAFKQRIVRQDLYDNGIRQILNFGHTIGHAIEALSLAKNATDAQIVNRKSSNRTCFHGYCVMYGMVAEAYLSHMLCGLPASVVSTLSRFMLENYGAVPLTCSDHEALIDLMLHDKKNREQGAIICILLRQIGEPLTGQQVTTAALREALEYLCSL